MRCLRAKKSDLGLAASTVDRAFLYTLRRFVALIRASRAPLGQQSTGGLNHGRVRRWRGARRVRCVRSTAFAAVLSPAPIGPFPSPALSNGRADLPHPARQWHHAPRIQNARSEPLRTSQVAAGTVALHASTRWSCATPPAVSLPGAPPGLFTPKKQRAPLLGPFADACDASQLSASRRGVHRHRHSRRPSLLRRPSTPEAPFLHGNYPGSPVVRASPSTLPPGLPLARFWLPRALHRRDFPSCCAFHLPHAPMPLP